MAPGPEAQAERDEPRKSTASFSICLISASSLLSTISASRAARAAEMPNLSIQKKLLLLRLLLLLRSRQFWCRCAHAPAAASARCC